MLPAPAAGLLWALIDAAVLHYSMLHPIHYLVESSLLMALHVSFGVLTAMFYSCVLLPPLSCKMPFDLHGMH